MATTYRIKEWGKFFVKADALRGKRPPWISVPTSHSGYGIRTLSAMPGGAETYGAFILIASVVSRTDTAEGRLVDGDRVVDSTHLSVRTGFPKSMFDKALPILSDIGWLIACDLPAGCKQDASNVQAGCTHDEPLRDEMGCDEMGRDVTDVSAVADRPKDKPSVSKTVIEEIYQAYPRKVGKAAALKEIRIAVKKIPHAELLVKVQAYAESVASKKGTDDWKYILHPERWFKKERWLDEAEAKPEPVNMDRFYGPDGELRL